jgi:myo-inositol 2-dehydrogenase / D-chiro-inositol 1-dehydrogenase
MNSANGFSRRKFLQGAAAATLPAWFLEAERSHAAQPPSTSPNEKPNVALVGCGGMGSYDITLAAKFGNVVALCDVDESHAGKLSKTIPNARIYKDFRRVLERNDVQVILNATPDHWHTLVNLGSLKAGKDVYSEKPLTLTIDEGKRVVAAVRDSKRILQTGSQQRSDGRFRLACELVRNGRLGKLTQVTTILPSGLRGGPFKTATVPAGLDWDFWQGQTPSIDYVPERCHFSFRYWYTYSGGTMTDWGAHHNDIALWGMGLEDSGPSTIEGRPLIEPISGGFTAASEYEVNYTYANGVHHRCMSTPINGPTGSVLRPAKPGELPNGIKFEGPDGWIFVTRGKIEASRPEILSAPLTSKQVGLYVSNDHMRNFFDCVRSRKAPIAEAAIGHRSVSVCHLGVLAIRLGRKLNWDPVKEQFINDKEADGYLTREMRKPWSYEGIGV